MPSLSRAPLELRSILIFLCGVSIVGIIASYVLWQGRFFLTGPVLTLTEEPARLQNERAVLIQGSAENITKITLNDRPIFTDPSGNFAEGLVLENGYTIMTLHAEDRYGRSITLERSFMYTPKSLAVSN